MLRLNELGSNYGLGTAGFSGDGGGYGFGSVVEEQAILVMQKARESYGVKVFDTAPIYGFGEAEVRLGKAAQSSRGKYFIITKTGVGWHSSKRVNMSNDPKLTLSMLEDSLRRLNTDYIDAVLVHWPDRNVDIRKTYEVLAKAKLQGKINYLGLSNTNLSEINLAKEVDSVDIVQGEYNIFNQSDVITDNEFYSTSWGSFDKGIATGRVFKNRVFDSSDCRSWAPWWKKSNKEEKVERVKNLLDKIPQGSSVNHEEVLVKYSIEFIKKSGVNCPLFGVKSEKDLDSIHHSFNSNIKNYPDVIKLLEMINE